MPEMSEPTRLDKCVAALVPCSRGEAQQYIEGGWVLVDGVAVEEPQALVTAQQVQLAPGARLGQIEPATVLLHKPAGVDSRDAASLVTPAAHFAGDASDVRMLKRHFHRLAPLMPLDVADSGLLVLTQDGRVRRRLTEDHALIEQEFVVEVAGDILPYGLSRLGSGMHYNGAALPPCKVSWQSETRLRFAIKAVQPGQLRHMCRQVGLDVVSIRRLRIGRIPLGKMPVGEWRYLAVGERF